MNISILQGNNAELSRQLVDLSNTNVDLNNTNDNLSRQLADLSRQLATAVSVQMTCKLASLFPD